MAMALGTCSILMPNNSCRFLHPFGSHHLNQQSVSTVRGYAGFSSSLQIIYKEIKPCPPMTTYVCRSQSRPSLTSPETKRAFISVYNKSNLSFLGLHLLNLGYTIVSSGGTATVLENAGVPVTRPQQLTDYRELLDGLVKQRDQKQHIDQHRSGTDDIVVVNSSTFYDEASPDVELLCWVIDAFTMRRDALVVVDPQDYCSLLAHLEGKLQDKKFGRKLARKAFEHAVSLVYSNDERLTKDKFPSGSTVPLSLQSTLRYGEMAYRASGSYISEATIQHHGKEMSGEDYVDASAAWDCVSDFVDPTCVVVQYMDPCGIASRDDIVEAYKRAINASHSCPWDGGIMSFNVEVDETLATEIRESVNEEKIVPGTVVVAPAYSKKGLEILGGISKNLRVLEVKKTETEGDVHQFRTASNKSPTKMELDDVKFAWRCGKHHKSDAVMVVKNKCLLGVATWLPNGLDFALRIAMGKAGEEAKGAILASNAFFPVDWKDPLKEACEGGVSVIVGPGGSIGDTDAIDFCNNYGVSLVFTGASNNP